MIIYLILIISEDIFQNPEKIGLAAIYIYFKLNQVP